MESLLGNWKTTAPKMRVAAPAAVRCRAARLLVDRPGAAQTEIAIGGLLFERRDPDFFPMTVLNHALGGSSSSRLFRELREREGLRLQRAESRQRCTASRLSGGCARECARMPRRTRSALMLAQLKRIVRRAHARGRAGESQSASGRAGSRRTSSSRKQVMALFVFETALWFFGGLLERYPAKLMAVTAR
jgi:predicted Zn-dependent peptidase